MPPSFSPPPPPMAADGGSEDRRGGDEAAVDAFFRRTPHLDLSETEPLAVGQALTAAVFLDTEAARPGETVQEVVIDLPVDLEVLEIDVLLAATEHFAITNECMKTLSMHRDDARSPDLTFDLEVVSAEPAGVAPALTAFLTYQHRPCGRVHRTVELQGMTPPPAPAADGDGRAGPAGRARHRRTRRACRSHGRHRSHSGQRRASASSSRCGRRSSTTSR